MLEKSWIIDAKWKPSWRSLGVIITRVVKANLNKLLWSSRWASLKGKKIEEGSLVDNKKLSFFDKWMIWVVSGPHKRVHCWKKEITIPYVVREVRNMIEDVRRGLKVKPLIRRFIINQTDSLFFKLYYLALAISLILSICNSVRA